MLRVKTHERTFQGAQEEVVARGDDGGVVDAVAGGDAEVDEIDKRLLGVATRADDVLRGLAQRRGAVLQAPLQLDDLFVFRQQVGQPRLGCLAGGGFDDAVP